MVKIYKFENERIILERELNELDNFVENFLKVLKKHSDYLIVSGFVSISTGRTRGTEDVDILFPVMNEKEFEKLFSDLIKNNFWCYQGDNSKEVYTYIKEMTNIRFAKKDQLFPNIEFIPINESRKAKFFEFSHPQKIIIIDKKKSREFEFKIPMLEFEILYKEIILGGKKDLEDAKHLRTFFSEILKEENFKKCKEVIKHEKTKN